MEGLIFGILRYLFSKFYEMKLEVFVEFCPWPHLAVKGLSMPSGDKSPKSKQRQEQHQ